MSRREAARLPRFRQFRRPVLEVLEDRLAPAVLGGSVANQGPGVGGYDPAQIRTAYGINNLALDGKGQTIAILGLFGNPRLLADLDAFDQAFGTTATGSTLFAQYGPASSFLTVYNQNGKTSPLPGPDPNDNTEAEEVLDVEWAHALAPGAKIDFVEASTDGDADSETATITAANLPGVTVFSTSYSDSSELWSELSQDADYQVPNVTFVAASGDNGTFDTGNPVFSPYFVSVGGTSLYVNSDSTYLSETGWGYGNRTKTQGGSGGGVSQYETEPAYQQGVQTTGKRTVPDVAFNADPATGMTVVDSYDDPGNPFTVYGGTSLSAPSWAGLMALVNEGRAAGGQNPLDHSDPTQTLEALYSLPNADYHDNLGGSNGTTTTGLLNVGRYNEVTGLGSPNAPLLVPDLIAYGGPLALNQSSLPGGTALMPYNQFITARGGTGIKTLTYAITSGSLPAGLSFQAGTSELAIAGTSMAAGTVGFTVTATDSTGLTATQSFTLTIQPNLKLSPGSLPAGTIQASYNQAITSIGGAGNSTLTVSNVSGSIPGLNIPTGGTNSLSITGTPTALGTVSFTVAATDAAGDTTSTNYSIAIGPGPASMVVITTQPQTLTAGAASSIITAQLEDAHGDVIVAGSAGITFTLSSTSAVGKFLDKNGNPLSSSQITVAGGQATASFEYEDTLAGAPAITVSVAGFSAKQQETVVPAVASALGFASQPVALPAGQASAVLIVELLDRYGNPVSAGSGGVTVNLSSSFHSGTFRNASGKPLSSPTVVIDAGTNTAGFEYADTRAGTPTLTLTAISLTGATQQETVTALHANHLTVTAPGMVIAGEAFNVAVHAEDFYGNVDTSFSGSVVLALHSAPAGVTVSGTTAGSVKAGAGTLTGLSLNAPGGPDSLIATCSALSGISNPITVSPTTHVVVVGTPAHLTAGGSFTFTLSAETATGHVDPTYRGTVVLTSSDPQAHFAGGTSVTFTAGNKGIATVTVTLKTAGSEWICAADTRNKSAAGTSPAVVVAAADLKALKVTGASSVVAGNPYAFKVSAVDSYGNVEKGYTGTVYLGSNLPAAIPGNYAFSSTDQGSHTFMAALLDVGQYMLTASDPVHGLYGSETNIRVVAPATSAARAATRKPISLPMPATTSPTRKRGTPASLACASGL